MLFEGGYINFFRTKEEAEGCDLILFEGGLYLGSGFR